MSPRRKPLAETDHPLRAIEKKRLGEYALRLGDLRKMPESGWRGFSLLAVKGDHPLEPPLVRGIFSAGAKHGVREWMDISLAQISRPPGGAPPLDLVAAGLAPGLFLLLSSLIPPGGHIMVSYEEDEPIHRTTLGALNRRVPPVATPIGALLFESGFRLVKNWHLSEGGHEGPRKLWGEKPPDEKWRLAWEKEAAESVIDFLERNRSVRAGSEDFERSRRVLEMVRIEDPAMRARIRKVLGPD